jgi:hypothetical protein
MLQPCTCGKLPHPDAAVRLANNRLVHLHKEEHSSQTLGLLNLLFLLLLLLL